MSEEGPGMVHQVADAVAAPMIPLTLDGIATAVHDKAITKIPDITVLNGIATAIHDKAITKIPDITVLQAIADKVAKTIPNDVVTKAIADKVAEIIPNDAVTTAIANKVGKDDGNIMKKLTTLAVAVAAIKTSVQHMENVEPVKRNNTKLMVAVIIFLVIGIFYMWFTSIKYNSEDKLDGKYLDYLSSGTKALSSTAATIALITILLKW